MFFQKIEWPIVHFTKGDVLCLELRGDRFKGLSISYYLG